MPRSTRSVTTRSRTTKSKARTSGEKKNPKKTPGVVRAALEGQATSQPPQQSLTLGKLLLKSTLLALLFAFIMLLVTGLIFGAFFLKKTHQFTQAGNTSVSELTSLLQGGIDHEPVQTNGYKNILVLGVDSLANRGDAPPLTDTVIVASVQLSTGKVHLLSIPRDTWIPEYSYKINSLYSIGLKRDPEHPTKIVTEEVQKLTGADIHHTMVISLDNLSTLVDMLGGLEVDVPTAFTDEMYPRSDVDITTERDPKKLYETISFDAGKQTMNGERVLQYVRSRHSAGITGSDFDRSRRQQLVVSALISTLKQERILKDTTLLGSLFKFYKDNFDSSLPMSELIATAKTLMPHKDEISITSDSLSIYPTDPKGVLYNPPLSAKYSKQWVLEIRNMEKLKAEAQQKLFDVNSSK